MDSTGPPGQTTPPQIHRLSLASRAALFPQSLVGVTCVELLYVAFPRKEHADEGV